MSAPELSDAVAGEHTANGPLKADSLNLAHACTPIQSTEPTDTPLFPAVAALLMREMRLFVRRRTEAALPLVFFVAAAGLFPFAVGSDPPLLRAIGPGVVWVCALLAALLSVPSMFATDHADGALEQWLLTAHSLPMLLAAKMVSHWLATGLPLVLVSPVLALAFGLPGDSLSVLVASLLLGSTVLSAIGTMAAALTLGLRNGALLLVVLTVPLVMPALVFGAGAVSATESGQSAAAHLSLLGAMALASVFTAPFVASAALRVALE